MALPPYLTKPMTIDEIKSAVKEDGSIENNVLVDLSEIIDNDLDGLLDILADRLVDSIKLMDISYKPIGTTNDGMIIMKVSGNVTEIIIDSIECDYITEDGYCTFDKSEEEIENGHMCQCDNITGVKKCNIF